jgi:pyruvate/2-oxoglutarate/acetoin dehydrogenase E1 component
VVPPDVRDELVEARIRERVVLHLRHGPPARHAQADGGTEDPGFGAELAAILAEKAILDLRGPVLRVTGYDVPYPYWKIEDAYMPSVERFVDAARKLLKF